MVVAQPPIASRMLRVDSLGRRETTRAGTAIASRLPIKVDTVAVRRPAKAAIIRTKHRRPEDEVAAAHMRPRAHPITAAVVEVEFSTTALAVAWAAGEVADPMILSKTDKDNNLVH